MWLTGKWFSGSNWFVFFLGSVRIGLALTFDFFPLLVVWFPCLCFFPSSSILIFFFAFFTIFENPKPDDPLWMNQPQIRNLSFAKILQSFSLCLFNFSSFLLDQVRLLLKFNNVDLKIEEKIQQSHRPWKMFNDFKKKKESN